MEIKHTNLQRGFTLIELLIAVTIIAIITSIALPSYRDYIIRSNRAAAVADLLEMSHWMERQFTIFGRYNDSSMSSLPVSQSPKTGDASYNLSISESAATTYIITATPVGAQINDTQCGSLSTNHASVECIKVGTGSTSCSNDPNAANRATVRKCVGGS